MRGSLVLNVFSNTYWPLRREEIEIAAAFSGGADPLHVSESSASESEAESARNWQDNDNKSNGDLENLVLLCAHIMSLKAKGF